MSREHPVRDAGLAVSLLTVVPTSARWPDDGATQCAAWFPLVGGMVGFVGYIEAHLAEVIGATPRGSLVVAGIIVATWALLTRMLHWDGLADTADGFWGSHERQRRLEIMDDSRTGAFGATTVAGVAVLEVAALGAILAAPHQLPVLLVPVVSRFSATAAAWFGVPARPDGLGRSVMGRPTALGLLVALATLGGATALFTWAFHVPGLVFAVSAVAIALAVPHLLSLRFGGVTGDVMGASVLLTETLLFVIFSLVW